MQQPQQQAPMQAAPPGPTTGPTTGPMTGMAAGPTPAHEITHGPSFAMLRVDLQPGQTIVAEAGSMVARHSNVHMEVKMNASPSAGLWQKVKGFVIAFIRKIVGGETFFVNHFSAQQGGAVWVAPTMAGSISHRRMQGETLTLSTGAFLASSGPLETSLKFGGLKSLLAKEGAFFLQISGHGDLWFNSYGGIHAIDVNGPFMIDNGHLVGFEGNLTYTIRSAGGGAMGFIASGEGLVCEFNGQGRVYVQSRNVGSLIGWLSPLLPS